MQEQKQDKASPPKVFISYAWGKNKDWAKKLAERLVRDGVYVIFDIWDLKEGQDRFSFMERSISNTEVKHVLVISDQAYAEKANSREGGVGTETQVITPSLYKDTDQTKIIPIVIELNEKGELILPTYLDSRIAIDFSDTADYERAYEQLLRIIFDKPKEPRPKLGTPPAFLYEERTDYTDTRIMLNIIKYNANHKPEQLETLSYSFINAFISDLKKIRDYSIIPAVPVNDVIDKIRQMLVFQRAGVEFTLLLVQANKATSEIYQYFFEELIKLHGIPNDAKYRYDCDDYKFLTHELFLLLCSIFLKNKKCEVLSDLIYQPYFYTNNLGWGSYYHYIYFRNYSSLIERNYRQKINSNRVSITSDLLFERLPKKDLSENDLIQIDLLLSYISILHAKDIFADCQFPWYPVTISRRMNPICEFFPRLRSKKYFYKVKSILGVSSIEELKASINNIPLETYLGIRTSN